MDSTVHTTQDPELDASLARLDSLLLRSVAQTGQIRRFAARDIVLKEGEPSDSLYIIVSGRLKSFSVNANGREVVFGVLMAGGYFGELMLDGGASAMSVMALEPSSIAVVPGESFRRFVGQNPDFALNLIFKLIRLVRNATENIKGLALDHVHSRLLRLLSEMAIEVDGQRVIEDRLTQQDMAHRIGSSREMVSRVLRQLIRDGIIEMTGRRIVILQDPPSLNPIAERSSAG